MNDPLTPTTEELDFSRNETPQEQPSQIAVQEPLNPELILKFAKQILAGSAVVAIICIIIALFGPHWVLNFPVRNDTKFEEYVLSTGETILDVVTTVIPPIVTLVLGFYFGKKASDG